MRAGDEDEDEAFSYPELHCRCGVVCSRAVKAAIQEAERIAAKSGTSEMVQIAERVLESLAVRHFLLPFEEQDWPELLQSVAAIGIQALNLQYGRSAQLVGLSSLRTLAKWLELHRTWPNSLDLMSRTGSLSAPRNGRTPRPQSQPSTRGRAPVLEGIETDPSPECRGSVAPGTPPSSCAMLRPALGGIRARAQVRSRSAPVRGGWSPRSSPRGAAPLPWRSTPRAAQDEATSTSCRHFGIAPSQFSAPLPSACPAAPIQPLPAREPITSREPITTLPPPTLSDSTATFGAVLPTSPPLGPGRPGPGPHFTPMPPMPCTAPCTSPLPQSSPAPLAPMPPSHPTNPDFSPRRARMTGGPIDDREPLRRWRLREGAASSAREQPPAQDEWYHTLMSRLRRLGEVAAPGGEDWTGPSERIERSEPVAYTPSRVREPLAARSSSRDALHAKLRELDGDRLELPISSRAQLGGPAATPGSFNAGPARLLSALPDRALRRDSHYASLNRASQRSEELIF
eukprot:s2674_g2.t1